MLVLGLNPWVNLAFILLFNAMVFIPVKWCYPSRTRYLPRLTFILTMIFGIFGITGLIMYPDVPMWIIWGSFAYIVYYVVLSFWSASKSEGGIFA
jgi:phosphatidylcholine synthase